MKNNKKGFTLIELMVVVAIIGILAGVVLVSLQSARNAAEDANRIAAISQIRSLAQTHYATRDLSYATFTTVNVPDLLRFTTLYGLNGVSGTEGNLLHIRGTTDAFCASIMLHEREGNANRFFCTDALTLSGRKTLNNRCFTTSIACN